MTLLADPDIRRTSSNPTAWIVVIATTIGAVLRFEGLAFGLPQVTARPDEEAIVSVAMRIIAHGPNPQFFRYPTLFMYLMAGVYRAYFAVEPALSHVLGTAAFVPDSAVDGPLFLLSRAVAAAAGTLTIPLVFASMRRLTSPRVAAVAAWLLAVAFLHVRDSHFGVTDVPATFLIMAAFTLIVSGPMDRLHLSRVVITACLCGLAAATKYNAGLIIIPLLVKIGLDERGPEGRGSVPTMIALAVVVAFLAFVAATPYAFLDFGHFRHDLIAEEVHLATGHGAELGRGWLRHLQLSLWYGIGPAMLAASLVGAIWLIVVDVETGVILLSFPLIYYGMMGGGRTVFVRYMIPIVPFLCMLAAWTVDAVGTVIAENVPLNRRIITMVLTGAVAWTSLVRGVRFDQILRQPDSRQLARAWFDVRYPTGVSLYQTGSPYGWVMQQPADRFPVCDFDPDSGRFEGRGCAGIDLPRVIIVQRSPLSGYSDHPPLLDAVLMARYQLVGRFNDVADDAVYDPQDAFFVPIGRLDLVHRPGPAFDVFERR